MKKLIINTIRESYRVDQIEDTMTAGELIRLLEEYDENTPVYLAFDNYYTFGGITESKFAEE